MLTQYAFYNNELVNIKRFSPDKVKNHRIINDQEGVLTHPVYGAKNRKVIASLLRKEPYVILIDMYESPEKAAHMALLMVGDYACPLPLVMRLFGCNDLYSLGNLEAITNIVGHEPVAVLPKGTKVIWKDGKDELREKIIVTISCGMRGERRHREGFWKFNKEGQLFIVCSSSSGSDRIYKQFEFFPSGVLVSYTESMNQETRYVSAERFYVAQIPDFRVFANECIQVAVNQQVELRQVR